MARIYVRNTSRLGFEKSPDSQSFVIFSFDSDGKLWVAESNADGDMSLSHRQVKAVIRFLRAGLLRMGKKV